MEGLIFFVVLILVAVLIVIPIILMVNMSSLKTQIGLLQRQTNDISQKLMYLINQSADKKDIEDIIQALASRSTVDEKAAQPEVVTERPAAEEKESLEIVESEVEAVSEIVEVVEEEIDIAPQNPLTEEVMEEPEPVPVYAAISNEEPQIVIAPSVAPAAEKKAPEKNVLERILGDNWLSKVGIVTLVLGIGFFVKYAIDQNWINEIGRVGIGLLTGGIIIGVAHKLKKQYHVFSSILVGGGISVFYITITLAFREYAIFSQPVAFILLTIVTIFSVILSLLYNRQELAVFSLIGGFLSPLMISTGSGNYIVLFSFLLILNTSMLVISLKKNWRLIGIISYVLSLIFFWVWLLAKFENEYAGATVFASLFFIQFYLLAIIEHYNARKQMSLYQAMLILTNNLSVFLALMIIFSSLEYNFRGLATIAIAVFNAVVMTALFRQARIDRNMIFLIVAVVMSLVSLAIPIQLKGHVITMFWAAEAVLLLWLWQRSRINVFRLGFLIITFLTIISYIMDAHSNYSYSAELGILVNRIFITGIVVLASFTVNLVLLRKEDKDLYFKLKGVHLFKVKDIINVFRFLLIIFAFTVPYLELNHQLGVHTDGENYVYSFRHVSLAVYTGLFVAALAIVFRNRIDGLKFSVFFIFSLLYTFIFSSLTTELREDIYLYNYYTSAYFLIHYLSLPAIGYILYILTRNIKNIPKGVFKPVCWLLVILSVSILSVELDHTVIGLLSTPDNYFDLLYDVHTFGYPILWGMAAMVLMIWGLKKKEVILRQISLISFGLIILKFYVYDVWHMSQGGRIFSFVFLGVILLTVSFLQQKIKVWVKDDKDADPDPSQGGEQ